MNPRRIGFLAYDDDRIGSNTATQGMFKPLPHIRGVPTFDRVRTSDSEIRWKFADDQGRVWSGLGLVEPAPDDKSTFIVTLRVARQI